MRMKIRKKGLFSCLTVCLMGAAICLGSFRIREFQVEKKEAFLSRERAVSAESAAGANEGDNSIAWKKAWQEGTEEFIFVEEKGLICYREEKGLAPSFSFIHCGVSAEGELELYEKYTALFLFDESAYTKQEWEQLEAAYADILEKKGTGLHCFMTPKQEGKYVNEAMKSYSLNKDYISKETFLELYREHGLGDFLYTYPQWNIIFQDGFWQPDTEWSWEKKNQAKAFTNLIWREEWSQQAETYSLYYDAGEQLQQLQIHYADGKAKRYAYDTSMREVYHEEGQFWEKEEIGLIQLTEETKPDEKEKNVYRQPAAEVFKALYLPVLEEEKGETPLFIGSQGKYLITEAEQRYEEFSSFPHYVFSAEFNEQRLIDTIEIGVSENGVVVYGIVDGEYREVESLHLILKSAKAYNEEESGWVWQLLHYEMGQLTENRIVPTDIEAIRKEYPHLDYWERG